MASLPTGRELRLSAKAAIKRVLTPSVFGANDPPIVVASTGRSASTLLCDSIAGSLVRHRFPRVRSPLLTRVLTDAAMEFAVRLADIQKLRFPVIKTHDFPEGESLPPAKYVFVFGDPLESAQSVEQVVAKKGERWFQRHLRHLRGSGHFADLYRTDALNYEAQVTSWISTPKDLVLLVPFDRLWDLEAEIASRVGFPVALPPRRQRISKPEPRKINDELFRRLRCVYRRAVDEADSRVEPSNL